ncbi:MAG: pyridoxamine 5'-phosphate oxidase family protein [Actinomycetota bacterium]|nr:pyridoxamine 5'-phosphate oxidase family protein [Actinomycetota bacterium]
MPIPREQLRLAPDELDELCASVRTAHVGTATDRGPHVVPLWFVWFGGEIWISNLRKSRRLADLARGSPVAICVDDGFEYAQLRGAVFYGRLVDATGSERLGAVRAAFAAKYWGGAKVPELKSHVWLRLEQERLVSWDFRKIPAGRDKRLEAGG